MPLMGQSGTPFLLRMGRRAALAVVFGGLAAGWLAGWLVEGQGAAVPLHQALKLFVAGMNTLVLLIEIAVADTRLEFRRRMFLWVVVLLANAAVFLIERHRYAPIY